MSQATISERPYVNSNLFSGHYLDERLQLRDEWKCDEKAAEVMNELQSLYELEGGLVKGYNEDSLLDNWIDEVLDILGFGTQVETSLPETSGFVDILLYESDVTRRDAAGVYLDTQNSTNLFERGIGLVEAKQWDADFTTRFSEQRPYRNASHQIKHYLEQTPENIQWGILTNGRKWRLYGTNDYETQTYYEVDLPELLEQDNLEAFKYFYLFFRPAAFRESVGTTFLDEVWSESETAVQELGEDLQDNVFTALRILGHGFVETNDLNLSIDPNDEEGLDELKDQSLVLLYRLMFILYAEARGLIHPEGPAAKEEYQENFSLDALRLEIHDSIGEVDEGFDNEFSKYSTSMWNQLEDLFRLIDKGEESLGIPPYNGGLFDHDEHAFLTEHEVSNRYLAEVIYRLSTTQNGNGRYMLADYADLDTRHLGSVYEGLLEHQFQIAPKQYAAVAEDGGQVWKPATEVTVADAVETVPEGGLYVVNDEGERKATGAYYTPDYVVTYIVEETVGPLIEDLRQNLIDQGFEPGTQEYLGPFLRRVTDLKILDPAMGSGHFLTRATGYLAEEVMSEVRDVEVEMGVAFDEQYVRREIAKECIYGVDLNGMAVELAKLSMWLETLAADRPLAFLDHHFKQGNSLVGSDIEAIEELKSDTNGDNDQYSLAEFGATREGTIERLMDIYSEFLAIENETVEDVQEMKRKYAEIEQDELRRRLVAMANVHTAERFGLDVPSGAYEWMAKALEDNEEWERVVDTDWFVAAHAEAESNDFFHWKLAFPEAFYNLDGSVSAHRGFDVILGNPPYLLLQGTDQQEVMRAQYPDIFTGSNDIAHFFLRQGGELLKRHGKLGFIVTRYWLEADRSDTIREYLSEELKPRQIIDFNNLQVWPQVNVLTVIGIFEKSSNVKTKLCGTGSEDYTSAEIFLNEQAKGEDWTDVPDDALGSSPWRLRAINQSDLWEKVRENPRLKSFCELTQGIKTGDNDAFVVSKSEAKEYKLEREALIPLAKSRDIRRHHVSTDKFVIYSDNSFRLTQHPHISEYLSKHEEKLSNRAECREGKYPWWRLQRPRDREILAEGSRVLVPHYARKNRFAYSKSVIAGTTDSFVISTEQTEIDGYCLTGILNSSLLDLYQKVFAKQKRAGYISYAGNSLKKIPIAPSQKLQENVLDTISTSTLSEWELSSKKTIEETLSELSSSISGQIDRKEKINLSLLDYIGNSTDGPAITDIGFYQPPKGSADSILKSHKDEYTNLHIGEATCEREGESTVVIHATARYKPDNEDTHETDRWGYAETELKPAIQLTDLTENEADLIEAFVPVAVDKAGGFANFRETATKTNSLIDRLKALTLPDPDDVVDDLNRYMDAVERAEALDKKIQRTDDLIDEIVYELYGLTDEEIEVVEEAVAND